RVAGRCRRGGARGGVPRPRRVPPGLRAPVHRVAHGARLRARLPARDQPGGTPDSGGSHGVTDVAHDPSLEYAVAAVERRDERTRVLKHGDTFGVFDTFGDAGGLCLHEQGLYHRGTRHLSTYELRIAGGHRFLLLSSTLQDSSDVLTVDLTNPELWADGEVLWPQGLLHVHRSRFLWEGTCYERIALTNFGGRLCEIAFDLHVGADFADIFEVRGSPRRRRGRLLPPEPTAQGVIFRYEGLDGLMRETRVACDPPPRHDDGRLRFVLRAGPRATGSCIVAVS